jgi:hypothetical protein
MRVIHLLLTRHPNCDILGRVSRLIYDKPTITYADYNTRVQNSDGSIYLYNPISRVVRWERSNISLKVDSTENLQFKKYAIERLIGTTTESLRGLKIFGCSICNHALYNVISKLSKDQIDKLAGSIEPTTTPPEVTLQPSVPEWKPTLREKLAGRQYELIDLSDMKIE